MAERIKSTSGPVFAVTVTWELSCVRDNFQQKYDPVPSWQEIMKDIFKHFEIKEKLQENYMMRFAEFPCMFVDEHNYKNLKPLDILHISRSPKWICEEFGRIMTSQLNEDQSEAEAEALVKIAAFSKDPFFAQYFLENVSFQCLERELIKWDAESPRLISILHAYCNTLENSDKGLGNCGDVLPSKVALTIESQLNVYSDDLLHECLLIAISLCKLKPSLISSKLNILRLVQHMTKNAEIKREALTLLVLLFKAAEGTEREKNIFALLSTGSSRRILMDHIVGKIDFRLVEAYKQTSDKSTENEKKQQRYEYDVCCLMQQLQHLMLNLQRHKLLRGVLLDDTNAPEKVREFCNVASEADGKINGVSGLKGKKSIFNKLGFATENPLNEFNEVPPGCLALDCIHYFCTKRKDEYEKLVLENCYRADSLECPIGRASIELTKLLAVVFKVGEPVVEDCTDLHPIFFSHDYPFEEIFCICINILDKTWKEMKATAEDFTKVMRVVRAQILRVLQLKPLNLGKFEDGLKKHTYKDIIEHWQKKRELFEEEEMKAPQIIELRKELEREATELVRLQRLKMMERGCRFRCPAKGRGNKDKPCYLILSVNHKFLHYGEVDEKVTEIPPLDKLQKINVAEIKSLTLGKDCAHFNPRRCRDEYYFSLATDSNKPGCLETVDIIATDQKTYQAWVDGIKILAKGKLGKMDSKSAKTEIDMLLNIELKLQLLDLDGVTIPTCPLVVPPLPSNYNFCYSL
ncbi:engulfment and cell motility protein 1 isoform X2 [Hyalella azteca]|uniref:Engulfment and cell motility protein 1 isoform X2 n=1 Tax=Hyalella azteca TaxID=294128 RepID=A0A8B7NIL2_HYAAZ|nr:engulfment and cell motility protein 1 isoform X2 [Hyalella azteca]